MKNLMPIFLWIAATDIAAAGQEPIRVSEDGKRFVFVDSGKAFVPWGFNYDHDEQGRLIEDYWEKEWTKVEEDFREMKTLGANVVRIHLQVGRFMESASKPNVTSLDKLDELIALAEKLGLYLDLTGLGCYHKKDVPEWYDSLGESERWEAQAHFWEAVAARGAKSPAIFCYDLMNEPVSPAGKRKNGEWLGPAFAGKHFVQVISLDQKDRPRHEIARQWIQRLKTSIRKQDKRGLITVGLVDWSLDRPGLTSGFVPEKIAADLDFLAVHLYPETGKLDDALQTLRAFSIGKPVLIEETFPLKCTPGEFAEFLDRSKSIAAGGIGFYWGKSLEECRKSESFTDALMLGWLELFQRRATPER